MLGLACAVGLSATLSAKIVSQGENNYISYEQSLVKTTSVPSNQIVQAEITVASGVEKIRASDFYEGYAYYSTLTGSTLHKVDMRGDTPVEVGTYTEENRYITSIKANGQFVYIMTSNGDEGTYKLEKLYNGNGDMQLVGWYDSDIPAHNRIGEMVIEDNYLYVPTESDLRIFDISDSYPQLMSTIEARGTTSFGFHESVSTDSLAIADNYAYVSTDNGFNIYDISDIAHPSLVGSYSDSRSIWESRLVIDGNYAYYTTGSNFEIGNEVSIIDISNKTNPQAVGVYMLNKEGTDYAEYISIEDIAINGDYLYIQKFKHGNQENNYAHTQEGVITVDISDKLNPTFVEPKTIESFVKRFYKEVLGRTADAEGLAGWVEKLTSGEGAGADIARGFIFSPEFINQEKSNEDFVKVLYRAFFDREADTAGFSDWTTKLNAGTSREEVLNGFLYSAEFANLAKSYGILAVPNTIPVVPTGSLAKFIVGKTYYIPVYNSPRHVEKLVFDTDGHTLKDSWEENGAKQEITLSYSIVNNILTIVTTDGNMMTFQNPTLSGNLLKFETFTNSDGVWFTTYAGAEGEL